MQYLRYCLIIINALSFLFMLADKKKAQRHLRRIPERLLLLTAFLGGSPGILAGMLLFRHKTKHQRFILGVPAILTIQVLVWSAVKY